MATYRIAASRGRNPNEGGFVQRLEIKQELWSNTITSVEKDNYVVIFEDEDKEDNGLGSR